MKCEKVKSKQLCHILVRLKQKGRRLRLGPMDKREEDLKKKFFSMIKKTKRCWIWTGPTRGAGYGDYRISQKHFRAHRLSWLIFKGDIKKNICVCHKCDNRLCVNPKHLWLGTQKQNLKDASVKGRLNGKCEGEKSWKHKLTKENVLEIIKTYKWRKHPNAKDFSKKFNVSAVAIYAILNGKNWKFLTFLEA